MAPPSKPKTMIIADATEAKAASGATAAPTFAHPRAIICNEPPKTIPSVKCPLTNPINVQLIQLTYTLLMVDGTEIHQESLPYQQVGQR